MEEDLHKNNPWSKRLKDWEASGPGPEPLSGDWSRLVEKMDKPGRRGPVIWWWSGIILLGGLLSAILLFQNPGAQGSAVAMEPKTSPVLAAEEAFATGLAEASVGKLPVETPETELSSAASQASITSALARTKDETTVPNPVTASASAKRPDLPSSLNPSPRQGGPALVEVPNELELRTPEEDTNEEETADQPTAAAAHSLPQLFGLAIPAVIVPAPSLRIKQAYLANMLNANQGGVLPNTDLAVLTSEETPDPDRLSLAIGPQMGIYRPAVNIELPANTVRAETTAKSIAYSYGIGAQLRLGAHWGLQTGISRSRENSSHRFFLARRYNPANEVLDAQGNGLNRIALEYSTSYTKGEAEVELLRSADVPTTGIRFIRLAVILQEEVETTTIPLLLTYDLPLSGRFGLRLGAGAAWNRQQVSVGIRSRLSALVDMEIRRSNIRTNERLLESEFWTGQLSAGLVYRPFNRWEISFSPQWFTNISNLSTDQQLNAGYSRFSFSTGINYLF